MAKTKKTKTIHHGHGEADTIQQAPGQQRIVLAKGEVTGHSHDVIGDGLAVMDVEQQTSKDTAITAAIGDKILKVTKAAKVVHQEHGTVELPAGEFTVRGVREFDHAENEARKVRD
jgi:hypothetical protein